MSNTPHFGPEVANPCELAVLKEWTDYNGHFNVAYYVRAFDLAFAAFVSGLFGDAEEMQANTIRSRVTYLREVHLGRPLRFTTQVLKSDARRVSVLQTMYADDDQFCAAIEERVASLQATDPSVPDVLSDLARRHSGLFIPEGWGQLAL